jgi:tetratricopeptide (TPR) repeat protein
MLEKLGRIPESMKLLSSSVKNNPTHAASWVALANLYVRKGNTNEARICYKNAVEGDKRSYVAYQAWGVLESSLGKFNDARELYKKALAISPKSAHTLQAWSAMEMKNNKFDEAERLLSQAMKVMPSSTRIRLLCAELYELKGDLMKTRQIFADGASSAVQYGDAGFFQVAEVIKFSCDGIILAETLCSSLQLLNCILVLVWTRSQYFEAYSTE